MGETLSVSLSPLLFRCPVTGRVIESDFRADAHTLSMIRLFSVRLPCPACGAAHDFKMAEALAFDAAEGPDAIAPQERRRCGS
jgi:hypothetical protein